MLMRNCPQCGNEICYKRKDNYEAAVRDDNWCKECSAAPISRNCPECGNIITHKNRQNWIKAIRKQQPCPKCAAGLRDQSGEKNPFFGKEHTEETKEKIRNQDRSYTQTDAFRQHRRETSKYGKDNPMYGRSVYEIWVEKHGVQRADVLMSLAKKKWSFASSGEKNPMFGKPIPYGSGYGWKGWYKNWFFRSLRELAYMVNIIEAGELSWRSAETKDLRVPYVGFDGQNRTYRADFLVEEKYLIEVKPEKLRHSHTVRLKEKAAIAFCEENGLEYQIVDPPKLTDEKVAELYELKMIQFLGKYEEMFKEEYRDKRVLRNDCQR